MTKQGNSTRGSQAERDAKPTQKEAMWRERTADGIWSGNAVERADAGLTRSMNVTRLQEAIDYLANVTLDDAFINAVGAV